MNSTEVEVAAASAGGIVEGIAEAFARQPQLQFTGDEVAEVLRRAALLVPDEIREKLS